MLNSIDGSTPWGASHNRQIIDLLAKSKAGEETDLGGVFHEIAPRLKKRGLVIIISIVWRYSIDFKRLGSFNHAKHDVVIFQIWHQDELVSISFLDRFDCLEQQGLRHTVDPMHLKEAYLKNLKEYQESLVQGCHKHRVQLSHDNRSALCRRLGVLSLRTGQGGYARSPVSFLNGILILGAFAAVVPLPFTSLTRSF